ncbi:hypothetical protein [Chthonobacter albigriseus]|nr:hypothetical protein [Chthonobacter albigriseus]
MFNVLGQINWRPFRAIEAAATARETDGGPERSPAHRLVLT